VVGPELVEIDAGNGPELCHSWAARALAESFRLSPEATGPEPTLNGVISLLARQGKKQNAYTRLVTLVQEANLEPPEALCQLAEITGFRLYLTTNFDPLLAQALDRIRGQSEAITTFAWLPCFARGGSTSQTPSQTPPGEQSFILAVCWTWKPIDRFPSALPSGEVRIRMTMSVCPDSICHCNGPISCFVGSLIPIGSKRVDYVCC